MTVPPYILWHLPRALSCVRAGAESLYFGGQQWGEVNSWNPVGANQNNAMAIAGSAAGSRTVMFETLYMYNFLTGEMVPLLADGDYSWNAEKTELTGGVLTLVVQEALGVVVVAGQAGVDPGGLAETTAGTPRRPS